MRAGHDSPSFRLPKRSYFRGYRYRRRRRVRLARRRIYPALYHKNLEQYQKKHSASVNVIVTDQNNNVVELENQRTLKIKKDYVYLVTITVMSGDKVKTHNYTVTAIKSPITVTFTSIYNNFKDIIKVVPYGGTLTDIPEVPDYQPEEQAGYTTTVIKVGWDRADFTNLKSHIKVYAVYNITSERNLYRVIYHTDGGSEIPPRQYYYEEYLEEPEEPQKEGCVFFGWYKDKELKERFSFNKAQIGAENIDLYARWLQPVENSTSPDYFDFVLINNGKSYSISAKENIPMPETLILPSVYNGKPVTKIGKFFGAGEYKRGILARIGNRNPARRFQRSAFAWGRPCPNRA